MSKYIQIDIRLEPIYGTGGLSSSFPNLSKLLKNIGYTRVLEEEPSLYSLVDTLTRIRIDPAVPEQYKLPIARMEERFKKLRDEAREQLLTRRLNELDRTLYQLEDLFKDLEGELP